jgi:prepilin-type processing-associated H-X9-DG protein
MPAEQILAGDITDWPDAVGLLDADKNDNVQNPIDIKATFHNGSINILYADGHVAPAKWLTTGSSQGYFDPSRMSTHYQGTGYLYQTP